LEIEETCKTDESCYGLQQSRILGVGYSESCTKSLQNFFIRQIIFINPVAPTFDFRAALKASNQAIQPKQLRLETPMTGSTTLAMLFSNRYVRSPHSQWGNSSYEQMPESFKEAKSAFCVSGGFERLKLT